MIVMKFGGSSIESAEAIGRVISIVKSYRGKFPVVVVSAMGKTTDRLLRIGTMASQRRDAGALSELRELEAFHLKQLGLLTSEAGAASRQIAAMFENAAGLVKEISQAAALSPNNSDALLSYGERLSSVVLAAAMQGAGIPALQLHAERLVVTDGSHTKAAPRYWESCAKIRRAVPSEQSGQVAVMGGFIGSTESGAPTTLGRGGSDLTAALMGAAINAEEVQIWTDVNGMLSCDPRVLPGGRCLRRISYTEANEMAEWGAKVLHPSTIAPVMRQRVPVSIRNSRNADHPGTRIESVPHGRCEGLVKSIACQKNVALLRIHPHAQRLTPQFTALVKSIFSAHQTDFRTVNGKNSVEAVVDDTLSLPELISDLSVAGKVEVEHGLASASLIGSGVGENRGLYLHAVKTLAGRSIPFHAVGTALMRITFVVAEQELESAVEGLHQEFVKFQETGPFYREFETQRVPVASRFKWKLHWTSPNSPVHLDTNY